MTLVGHSLTGIALGTLVVPHHWRRRRKLRAFLLFGVLANGPDLPAPFWGHSEYLVSHSVFVTLGLIAGVCVLAALARGPRQAAGGWPVVVAGAAAWSSHLLLDSFYSHGNGIQIFWPLSQSALALPIPWFDVFHVGITAPAALRIFAIELACYGTLLGLCLLFRARRHESAAPVAPERGRFGTQGHPPS